VKERETLLQLTMLYIDWTTLSRSYSQSLKVIKVNFGIIWKAYHSKPFEPSVHSAGQYRFYLILHVYIFIQFAKMFAIYLHI